MILLIYALYSFTHITYGTMQLYSSFTHMLQFAQEYF